MRPESEEQLLTVRDVASVLKRHPKTVRKWIYRGDLPAVRLGRHVRIRRSDFDRLVRRAYEAPAGAARRG